MTTSSPALQTASKVEIIDSVEPQQTVTSVSGSTEMPCHAPIWRAIALRKFLAPQVMAYWFTSAATAFCAACLISAGAEKSGNPCARFTALCNMAWRVISRITDSVKRPTLSLRNCLPVAGAGARDTAGAPFRVSLARSGDFGRKEVFEVPAVDFLTLLAGVEPRFAMQAD